MELQTEWLGEVVSDQDLQTGDLFVFTHGDNACLALKARGEDANYVIILRQFGEPDGEPLPRAIFFEDAVPHGPVRRIHGGKLVALPVEMDAEAIFRPTSVVTPLGSLLIHGVHQLALRIEGQRPLIRIDLTTGHPLPAGAQGVEVNAWRLVWRFGDESLELCRFPSPG